MSSRRLHLLRHAKSSWDDPELADLDRPLAPRGRRAATSIARHLVREGIAPQLVLCSPSRRTRETLERLAASLGRAQVRIVPELYGASAATLLETVQGVPDDVESMLLIGHNPGVRELALDLALEGSDRARVATKFPTAALATLELRGRWSELGRNGAELASFVTPKGLAAGG